MAKKKLSKKDNPLNKLIPSYAVLKAQIAEDTKESNKLNAYIKQFMKEQGLQEKEVGDYVANYSTRNTETFDMQKLLDFCKEHKVLASCIKTAEYVDTDELENLIYNKKLSKKTLLLMDKLRVKKQTEYLTVTKKKEA